MYMEFNIMLLNLFVLSFTYEIYLYDVNISVFDFFFVWKFDLLQWIACKIVKIVETAEFNLHLDDKLKEDGP